MNRIDWRAIGAGVALYGICGWVIIAFSQNLVRAAVHGEIPDKYSHILSFGLDPVAFWWTVAMYIGGTVVALIMLALATYGVICRSKYGNRNPLKGRTGQSAAPLIDETKRSNR